jgi:predicted metal-dependent hydrolase
MAKPETRFLRIEGIKIPVKLIREMRNSVRISIARDSVNLRVPIWLLSSKHTQQNLDWAEKWLQTQFVRNPSLKNRFIKKSYSDKQVIQINGHEFSLKIKQENRKTSKVNLVDHTLHIILSSKLSVADEANTISSLISRIMGQYFLPEMRARVIALNQRYFQKEIGRIRLKHNKSNWGSCSAKKNINLSTRLLFAPKEVQDYVIIHELAHLIELNHSKKFWSLITTIDPDYKEKEKWLKKNAHLCQY